MRTAALLIALAVANTASLVAADPAATAHPVSAIASDSAPAARAATSAAPQPGNTATHTVTIENMRFDPPELTLHRGDRVTWTNKDFFPHTVTAVKGAFDSHSIPANASWTYVTNKPGEYDYICSFHPTMRGKLIVR